MFLRVRQFCFFFLLFMVIHIVMHVLNFLQEETTSKKRGLHKYKYGRLIYVNISQNVRTLYNLIICDENDSWDIKNVKLKNESNMNVNSNESDFSIKETGPLRPCPLLPPDLGPVENDNAIFNLLGIDDMYLWVQLGGIHLPSECLALQQVAIIVPIHGTLRARKLRFFVLMLALIIIVTYIFCFFLEKINQQRKKGVSRFQYEFNGTWKGRLKTCPLLAPNLGPVADDKDIWGLFGVDNIYLRTQPGGIHIPTQCLALQQVALVVPIHENHRTKIEFVSSFLYYIHPFLMKQQLEYQIFVILKPNATAPYKRGELFNIGFKEAQAYRSWGWDCIIFHDAHLVPLDTRNLYRCSQHPRMLIADFQKPYKFGGAVAVRPKHFIKANGFSNQIWANDGDYIDMYKRMVASNFTVENNVVPIGNYSYFESLRQENVEPETNQTNSTNYLKDGLSTVSYTIKNCMRLKQFYTLIEVEV